MHAVRTSGATPHRWAPIRRGAPAVRALLVQGGPSASADRRVAAAAELADSFEARLIGVGPPRDPCDVAPSDACASPTGRVADTRFDVSESERRFRAQAAAVAAGVSWTTAELNDTSAALIAAAHAADFIVVDLQPDPSDAQLDMGTLLRGAGRPVVACPGDRSLIGETVVVAWKDGPSCRRALQSAAPFLDGARRVHLVAIQFGGDAAPARRKLHEVAAALRLRGLQSCSGTFLDEGERPRVLQAAIVAERLLSFAEEAGADLLVAGAYGRSGVTRLALGSHTEELIAQSRIHLLLQA